MDQINAFAKRSIWLLSLIRVWSFHGLVVLFIVGLCAVSLLLIQENRKLKTELTRMENQRFLKIGEEVPQFGARTTSGEEIDLDFSKSEKTVLFVFQPQCRACEQVAPYWRRIQTASETRQYQVFGISLGEITSSVAFLSSNAISVETFVDLDAATKALYKLNLTPLTIVIDKTGKVEKIWPGALNRETIPDVESYFGISVADEAK